MLLSFAYFIIDTSDRAFRDPQGSTVHKPSSNYPHNYLSQDNRIIRASHAVSNPSLSLSTLAQAASALTPPPTDTSENEQRIKEIGTQTPPLCAPRLRLGAASLHSRVVNYFCRCNASAQRNQKLAVPNTEQTPSPPSNILESSELETTETASKRKRPNESEEDCPETQTAPALPEVAGGCCCAQPQAPQPVQAGCCARVATNEAARSPRDEQVGFGGCCGGESGGCCDANQSNLNSNSSTSAARERERAPSVASVSTRGNPTLNVVYLGSGSSSKAAASSSGGCPCANSARCASLARPLKIPGGNDSDDADSSADADSDAGGDSDAPSTRRSGSPPAREHSHERSAAAASSSSSSNSSSHQQQHQSRRSHVFKRYRRPQILICQCVSAPTPVTPPQPKPHSSAVASASPSGSPAPAPPSPTPILSFTGAGAGVTLAAPSRSATPKTPIAAAAPTSFILPQAVAAPPAAGFVAVPTAHSATGSSCSSNGNGGTTSLDIANAPNANPNANVKAAGTTVEATIGGNERTIHITLNTAGTCVSSCGAGGGCCASKREQEAGESAEMKPASAKVLLTASDCENIFSVAVNFIDVQYTNRQPTILSHVCYTLLYSYSIDCTGSGESE